MKIPDRWLAYSALGKCIAGTRFICFKVPLKDALCRNLADHERFTPSMLIDQCPKLGLVIDLTNTTRYYNGEAFRSKGIQYKKLQCPGQIIPPGEIVQEFFKTVDAFLDKSPEKDKLIGVHCTHGLNRTGYFICRYLSLRMGFAPKDAISAFEDARGYKIERQPFIEDIVAGKGIEIVADEVPSSSDQFLQKDYQKPHEDEPKKNHSYRDDRVEDEYYPPPVPYPPRNIMDYQSPLAGCSYDEYEVPSRYSRGYGDLRTTRGGYQGYSQHRNNPYGRPNKAEARMGPYREDTGRYGNKRWERRGDGSKGGPRKNNWER